MVKSLRSWKRRQKRSMLERRERKSNSFLPTEIKFTPTVQLCSTTSCSKNWVDFSMWWCFQAACHSSQTKEETKKRLRFIWWDERKWCSAVNTTTFTRWELDRGIFQQRQPQASTVIRMHEMVVLLCSIETEVRSQRQEEALCRVSWSSIQWWWRWQWQCSGWIKEDPNSAD